MAKTVADVMKMVEQVNTRLPHKKGYLKIAVMGCAVNGPGEARDADIGVAFGDGNGILFEKGELIGSGSHEELYHSCLVYKEMVDYQKDGFLQEKNVQQESIG